MASVKDVAKRANVAVSTVSKVVNNYEGVSNETKKKVLKAIKELNYIPNSVASALGKKNFNNVGILIINNNSLQAIDEIYMHYLLGAVSKCTELKLNHSILFWNSIQDKDEDELEIYFRSQMINSLIIFGLSKDNKSLISLIQSEKFLTVVTDSDYKNKTTSSISIDHAKAQYQVADELLKNKNVDSILYIAGKKNGFVTEKRIFGISELIAKNSLQIKIMYADFEEEKAYNITKEMMKDYDAIICASDLMAIGAIRALKDNNVTKPVSGFDGIRLVKYVTNDLLTVKQDFYEIARMSVVEMTRLIEGEESSSITVGHKIQIL